MNEWDKPLQSFIATWVERIQTMTETQVVYALRACHAARHNVDETLAFLNSVSLAPAEDSEDEIKQLKSDLNSYRRPTASPFLLSDHIEDAWKKRLETLRKRPNSDF